MEAKALLGRHGVALPRGLALPAGADLPPLPDWPGFILKAQLLEGGRGQRGLVRRVAPKALPQALAEMRAIAGPVDFLLEEAVAIERELYVAIRIDGTRQRLELIFSADGGVAVETGGPVAALPIDPEAPDAAERLYPVLREALPAPLAARLARECLRLARIALAEDLTLLEVNPLAVTAAGLVACDAKLVRDDAASGRHDAGATAGSAALEAAALTPLERRAQDRGFTLVEMPGDVAVVSAGAGLGMLLIDLLADHGFGAACFMDNRQGGPADTTEARLDAAFTLAERQGVRAILFYTTLASRPVAERVEALLGFLAKRPPPKPLFAGFAAAGEAARGFDATAAQARLASAGVVALEADPRALIRAMADAAAAGRL
jgi:succinyl-CoA synthetase beta subunit